MKNRVLIAKLKAGTATRGEANLYAARVARLREGWPCEHGHLECAVEDGGPCVDEVLSVAEAEHEEKEIARS